MYDIVKWVHVCSGMIWCTGLFLQSLLLLAAQQKVQTSPAVKILRSWEKLLSLPGILLVWATGIYLAMAGGWYQTHWLMVKAGLVVLLSGLHGIFAANIRRYYDLNTVPVLAMPVFIAGLFLLTAGIIFMVIVRPF
ncbi:MAG: CopD family protein [Candidatus Omnitrophica bacterium]|nr:CopD family protein [Candidatus Omnitrophota bacterium]MDE2231388.1 CopD family protein [Candidatus Omnitrophota bacterium]